MPPAGTRRGGRARAREGLPQPCAAVLDRIPLYRDNLVPPGDLNRSIAHNLRSILTAIGHPQLPLDLAAPQETGRRRAHQGVPLPEVGLMPGGAAAAGSGG